MIMHNCIKCDDFQMIPLASPPLPKMQKYKCPKCNTTQWIKHSRIDPCTYSEDSVEVDEETKEVTIKDDTQAIAQARKNMEGDEPQPERQ